MTRDWMLEQAAEDWKKIAAAHGVDCVWQEQRFTAIKGDKGARDLVTDEGGYVTDYDFTVTASRDQFHGEPRPNDLVIIGATHYRVMIATLSQHDALMILALKTATG